MTTPTDTGRLAGRLAAWASAWLAGRCGYDDALDRITGGARHTVAGLPDAPAEAPLGWALTALRTAGATAVRVALPAPGDPGGLPPAPPDVQAAAIDAGAAAIAVGAGLALVPAVGGGTVCWQAHALDGTAPAYLPVAEAEHALHQAVADATASLARLDVAQWRPELADALTDLRTDARTGRTAGSELPPDWPHRARTLLARADQLGRVVALAETVPGTAITAAESSGRARALGELARAVRRARLASYNCYGIEPPG